METLAGKKILFVITKSNWGGAQRYVYDLATGFKKRGAEIKVAFGGTGKANDPLGVLAVHLRQVEIDGIYIPSFVRDISLLREFKVLHELVQIFRKERPDVVHLNSSKAGGIGAIAGRLAGIRHIVFTSHGLAYDEDRPLVARALIWFSTWATFLFAHTVILISKDNYERARHFPFCKHKMRLVYNGISTETLEPRGVARAKLIPNGNPKLPWIGTISEMTHNKGLSYLIEAARLLKGRGYLFELCIIGSGEEYNISLDRIAEYGLDTCVHLIGFVENASRYLGAFDIFTLTSIKEGLPYVLLEAAQAGCAVIGTRTGGITDIIDATTGILVAPKDVWSIVRALETLLANEQERKTFGAELQKKVSEKFSIERMLTQTEALYH
ncbi:MAG TPA: glycosyltransferase family 4 protein [Candidatus Paceibacterota bacterium]|nr:glycosyltransferase family 4 protein [Candidatus Paceibacterota bacterium]